MRLVVGLGNPGREYEGTRHNIGFDVIERFAQEQRFKISKKGFSSFWCKENFFGGDVIFLLPQTFMNLSGDAVREVREYYKIADSDILVVHDDLDLVLGKVKFDVNAGAAGHRGVSSMIEQLGTKSFYRIRMGIGRPARKGEVEGFVLSPFSKEERESVDSMVEEALKSLRDWMSKH